MIRTIDASRVVDGIGTDAAAPSGKFDASELGQAEISSFADNLAAQLAAVDTDCVIGPVTDRCMRFLAGFDVGADAAVIKQIDRGQ